MNNLAQFPVAAGVVRHPRAGFESIPRDLSKAELLRYFTYTEKDVGEIQLCRGGGNRIGFALRRPTRHEHTERLRTYLGLRIFTHTDRTAVKTFVSERVRG